MTTEHDEMRAFNRARRRTGLDNGEPLSCDLVQAVVRHELFAINGQISALVKESDGDHTEADYEWAMAIIDRQVWCNRFWDACQTARELR